MRVAGSSVFPQRTRRAQQPLRQERRVDERLPTFREVHHVRGGRIDGPRDGRPRQRRILRALATFRRVVGRQLDPRGQAVNQPSERFEVSDRAPVGLRRLFDRHAGLQRPVRQILEDRIGDTPQDADPDCAITIGRGDRLKRCPR